jgi:hypothetical protein
VLEMASIKPITERAYYGPEVAWGGFNGNYMAKR